MAIGGKPLDPLAYLYCTNAHGQSHPAFPHTLHSKLGDLLDDPQDSQEGEAWSQPTVFDGATPSTNQVKRVV
jgi:hypothetical protein